MKQFLMATDHLSVSYLSPYEHIPVGVELDSFVGIKLQGREEEIKDFNRASPQRAKRSRRCQSLSAGKCQISSPGCHPPRAAAIPSAAAANVPHLTGGFFSSQSVKLGIVKLLKSPSTRSWAGTGS